MRIITLFLLLLISGCALINSNAVLPSYRSSEYTKKESPKKKETKKESDSKGSQATAKKVEPQKKSTKPVSKSTKNLIQTAESYLGVRYKFGGTTRKGLDCSGFIWKVQLDLGNKKAERLSSSAMYKKGRSVSRANLKVGDLCFFGPRKKVNHVGIYVGSNRFIHASSSKGVSYSTLDNVYWAPRLIGFKRLY